MASLVLMGDGGVQGVTGTSDGLAAAIQNEELTLGEGPATDSHRHGVPVLVEDMDHAVKRWPRFAQALAGLGVGSVFAFPLRVGAVKLGVLVLGSPVPMPLAGRELSECLVVVGLVSRLVVDLQAGITSERLASALDIADTRAVVHQATGMISAQLDVGVGEALVRLRAHAFAVSRPIDEVAREIVDGGRHFEEG